MAEVPRIVGDPDRLATLHSYRILDTLPEAGFDDVVMLARQICRTPVALVSFVESQRQWFKATSGTELCQTPIEQSVCAHALAQSDTLIVPDLTKDERTKENSLVTGEPHIRFYAGALLKSADGVPLGTLCVIDLEPRPHGLTAEQVQGLEALARQVMLQMELRRAAAVAGGPVIDDANVSSPQVSTEDFVARLQDNERRLRMAQEAGQIGTFEIDVRTNELRPSERFCRIYGLPVVSSMDAGDIEALVIADDTGLVSHELTRVRGDVPLRAEYRIKRGDDARIAWIARRAEFVKDSNGRPLRMLGTVQDITERKNADARQTLLNEELSHRLKNTLSLVQAIASQTLRSATDRDSVHAFDQRVAALSRAHDVLLQTSWTAAAMRAIVEKGLELHGGTDRYEINGPDIQMQDKAALSLSLLIHELATNAVKHGSLSVPTGRVDVSWKQDGDDLVLSWHESGGPKVQEPEKTGLGSRLIKMGLVGTSQVKRRYLAQGLDVEFRAPLSLIVESPSGTSMRV